MKCSVCGQEIKHARPCPYNQYGKYTCDDCCEKCHHSEPFPCREYGLRQDRKQAERVFPKGYVLQIDLKKFYPPGLWREAQMQIDHKKLLQQYQNKVNNAQGHFFEDYIKAACAFYKDRGRASVDKTPEPFRVLEKSRDGIFKGRFTARAQPDFQGTLAGGRSIVFEAKYTTTDRLKRDVLTPEQQDALEDHRQKGAVAAVCAGIGNDFFFVPWAVWRDMKEHFGRKYVTAADLEQWRVRFNGAVLFLDYTHERSGSNEQGKTAHAEIDSPGHTANGL